MIRVCSTITSEPLAVPGLPEIWQTLCLKCRSFVVRAWIGLDSSESAAAVDEKDLFDIERTGLYVAADFSAVVESWARLL